MEGCSLSAMQQRIMFSRAVPADPQGRILMKNRDGKQRGIKGRVYVLVLFNKG